MKPETIKPDISIVLPTYNEIHNVGPMVAEIEMAFAGSGVRYEIIFVDDSTDETPVIIERLKQNKQNIHLIHRATHERTGLGTAIVLGMKRASADVICTLDSDLQHPPRTMLSMYEALIKSNKNFVVASRMIADGSSEGLANGFRHVVSKASRMLAWLVLPLTRKTTDPMTGYFMLRKELLESVNFAPVGFKILVEFLARVPSIDSLDVPFVMRKREFGTSKASFKEGMRYLKHLHKLMLETPKHSILKWTYKPIEFYFTHSTVIMYSMGIALMMFVFYSFTSQVLETAVLTVSLVLTAQLAYTIYILVYAWDHADRMQQNASPKIFAPAKKSFTAILPALNEAEVIPYTIKAVANISYPEHLKETIIVLRDTDTETIVAASKTITELGKNNIRIQLISGAPFNKPHHLNAALKTAKNEVVCIFDAEDEPHHEIYHVVNSVMLRDKADVVQCGVQLMNFESNWYSLFNVLEYFLWFGSALHYYERQGVIPLGGNTVFFDTAMVRNVGGWDMHGLTEDAEIGIRLSMKGANIRVVYDPVHATQEETPPTLSSFIKQRTRWSQGFLQILAKRKELNYASEFSFKKRALIWYILGWSRVQAILFLYFPVSLFLSFFVKLHPVVTLVSIAPMMLLVVFLVVQNIALYEFTKMYNKKWTPTLILKTIVWFFPYQFILSYSSFRAMIRQMRSQTSWEKTEHVNAHRTTSVTTAA